MKEHYKTFLTIKTKPCKNISEKVHCNTKIIKTFLKLNSFVKLKTSLKPSLLHRKAFSRGLNEVMCFRYHLCSTYLIS